MEITSWKDERTGKVYEAKRLESGHEKVVVLYEDSKGNKRRLHSYIRKRPPVRPKRVTPPPSAPLPASVPKSFSEFIDDLSEADLGTIYDEIVIQLGSIISADSTFYECGCSPTSECFKWKIYMMKKDAIIKKAHHSDEVIYSRIVSIIHRALVGEQTKLTGRSVDV
jgi:hypothetical protein